MTPAPEDGLRSVTDRSLPSNPPPLTAAEPPWDAAGTGYRREWVLFCDYAAATGQPALPTTVPTLTGFFTALPAAQPPKHGGSGSARSRAHRRSGHLLPRPETGPAAPPLSQPRRVRQPVVPTALTQAR